MRVFLIALSVLPLAMTVRAEDVETVTVDFAGPGAQHVSAVGTNGAFAFDGVSSSIPLPADLPKKIGARDFSVVFEFQPGREQALTAYIFEHHREAPWTGLYAAIENNKMLRFRLKDVPSCSVSCDVAALLGDGSFHQVVLNRQGRTLEVWIDGESAVSQEKDELVDLAIDYGGNVPVVGSHCGRADAFYKGALRGMEFRIGRCMTGDEIRARYAASPLAKAVAEQQAAARSRLQGLLDQLRNGGIEERTRAVAELRKVDAASRAALSALKDDPDPEVRETIRDILAESEPPPAQAPRRGRDRQGIQIIDMNGPVLNNEFMIQVQ